MKPKYKIVCNRNAVHETKLYVKRFGIWWCVERSYFYDAGRFLIKAYEDRINSKKVEYR